MLMAATDEAGGMSRKQLRDEVVTLMLAGHETTAVALSWTFLLLSKHPDVARKLAAEVDDVLGDRAAPAIEDLARLRYTGWVVDESMRLYPPVWMVERQAIADDVIGGYRIPAGTYVGVSPWTLHRHPAYWENPEGFEPERFAPEREKERPRYVYLPFGGGPRTCIGNSFALMEAKILLATISKRYTLALRPGERPEMDSGVTLRPKRGIHVLPRRRAVTGP
jgi:cytochrome P450